jgi:hypothetical protein
MLSSSHFLKFKSIEFSDETLSSWFLRNIFYNYYHYSSIRVVFRYLESALDINYIAPHYLNCIKYPELIPVLAELTCEDEDSIIELGFPTRFPGLQFDDKEDISSAYDVYPPFNLYRATVNRLPRICPKCLKEHAYIRYWWHLEPYLHCPDHLVWMHEECGHCGSKWEMPDIIADECRECGKRLSQAPTESLSINHPGIEAQVSLVSWIENDLHDISSLQKISFETLFCFLYGLKDAKQHQINKNTEGDDGQISPSEIASCYVSALSALQDWPVSFYDFLDIFRDKQDSDQSYGFLYEFGSLYQKWLLNYWLEPEFEFLHVAFNEYLRHNFVPYDGMNNAKWMEYFPHLLDQYLRQNRVW